MGRGQGDLLPDCLVPLFLSPTVSQAREAVEQTYTRSGLIVITQSCDLANSRVQFVALCPIYTLAELEAENPGLAKKGQWENVREGHVEGLRLLASPTVADDNGTANRGRFGQIVSLPSTIHDLARQFIRRAMETRSPYLEHFSSVIARFFMHSDFRFERAESDRQCPGRWNNLCPFARISSGLPFSL